MVELTISCKCKICGKPITIKSHPNDYDLLSTSNNITRETPFFAYHHEGFSEEKGLAISSCKECGADYRIMTGIISVVCSLDEVDEEKLGEASPEPNFECSKMTFPKWLKEQQPRRDNVGYLAREAFYTDGKARETKKRLDKESPGRPARANEYDEWIKFLGRNSHALTAFRLAWAEYQFLKEYCMIDYHQ